MKTPIKIALVAVALAGGSLALGQPARAADVAVSVSTPGIAFGFTDGYWDQGHQWHQWRDQQEAARFRAENREHFYEHKHVEDRDQGWHDSDHYWEHH